MTDDNRTTIPMSIPLSDGEEVPGGDITFQSPTPVCPKCGNCSVVAVELGAAEGGMQTVRVRCIQCRHEFDVAPVAPEL